MVDLRGNIKARWGKPFRLKIGVTLVDSTRQSSLKYDTLYSQAGTWRQNTEKNIFIVTNKFWVPNLSFLKA